jgi:hypothetical protein
METLTEVTVQNLSKRIKSHALNAESAYSRLLNEGKISRDFVTAVGTRNDQRSQILDFGLIDNRVQMIMNDEPLTIHPHAVSQLGDKIGVPAKYLRQLSEGSEWEKNLCVQILKEHSGWAKRNRVLLRAVGQDVRGVLSDQYRRLNSSDIVENFVKAGYAQGAVLADGLMTDTRLYIEMLLPSPLTFETPKNGLATMAYGARLSTSDYGDGALELRVFTMQGVCLNGMVRESVMRSVHLGSRLPENLQLSERTYRLDTQTQVSAIKDLTKGLFDSRNILKEMELVQNASAIEIDIEKEIKLLPKIGLAKNEVLGVQKILIEGKKEDGVTGEPTLWKLVNGVTAFARDQENGRDRELQEIAGKLMKRAETMKK